MELILASAMISVVAVSLFATLRVAFKARDRALATVGPARAAEVAIDLLRRDLESALPPTGVIAGSFIGDAGLEAGGTSVVEFYAVSGPTPGMLARQAPGGGGLTGSPAAAPWDRRDATLAGGVRRVRLLVRQAVAGNGVDPAADTGMVLVRQTTQNVLAAAEPVPEEEILCRGVRGFYLRYFDGTQWLDVWDSTTQGNTLPQAIELTLDMDGPAGEAALSPGAAATATTAYSTTRIFFLPCYSVPTTPSAVPGGQP